MDTVLRAAVIYLFLMVILRGSGKRSLAQITSYVPEGDACSWRVQR